MTQEQRKRANQLNSYIEDIVEVKMFLNSKDYQAKVTGFRLIFENCKNIVPLIDKFIIELNKEADINIELLNKEIESI